MLYLLFSVVVAKADLVQSPQEKGKEDTIVHRLKPTTLLENESELQLRVQRLIQVLLLKDPVKIIPAISSTGS